MDWIKVDNNCSNLPGPGETVLAYSPVDGIGLAEFVALLGVKHWYWIHKRVNGSAQINNVTRFCRIEITSEEKCNP